MSARNEVSIDGIEGNDSFRSAHTPAMITPLRKDDELLADIRAASKDADVLHLWWLGQSGFLLQWQNRHLLIDPYLSDSLTKKYAETDKPHTRMTELVVDPRRLDFIDVVTSSHNHTDHLDAETLVPLIEVNQDLAVVVPAANRQFAAERLGVAEQRLLPIDVGQSVESSGCSIFGVPAAHETVEYDELGRSRYLGYVIRIGPWTVYHSGDTMLYDGMADQLSRWPIDVAILPINGRAPERRVAGNLDGREAVTLAHTLGARHVIPCHYDLFEFNTESPDLFIVTARDLGQPHSVLQCGERWTGTPRE